MTFAESLPSKALGWLVTGIGFLFRAVLIGWATLAIYYSNLPWASLRLVLSVEFMAFGFGPYG
jgi:hypothetical protein